MQNNVIKLTASGRQKLGLSTNNLALQVFTQRVQQRAACVVDNIHAGCTDDERHFIRVYFQSHSTQSFVEAITSCALRMVEQFRPSELQ